MKRAEYLIKQTSLLKEYNKYNPVIYKKGVIIRWFRDYLCKQEPTEEENKRLEDCVKTLEKIASIEIERPLRQYSFLEVREAINSLDENELRRMDNKIKTSKLDYIN